MGTLKFDITGNPKGYITATQQAERASTSMFNTINQGAREIDNVFKTLAKSAGSFFVIQQASQLVKQVASVRGEFQQLEVAFTTMLKSKEASDKLMAEAATFAASTPFDLKGVAAAIKQNLAYGASAETVIDEIRMLGNVASGVSAPLNDIVYLYGTLRTQGRAFTQDIRQFAGRGIPIYEELAKVLGVAKDEVADFVTKGKVGFAEVEKAFQNMTQEGGMFYNLMDDQSKTIVGQISNLGDNIDMMFNEIGRSQEGLINNTLGAVNAVVQNYEKVGNVLATLVATYGAYKTAVIAVSAARKVQKAILEEAVLQKTLATGASITLSNAEAVEAAKTIILQRAKQGLIKTVKALNNAILANPYALAAAAIAGVVVSLNSLTKGFDGAKMGAEAFEKYVSKQNEALEKTRSAVAEYLTQLESLERGSQGYKDILEKITEQYPELLSKYGEEKLFLTDIRDLKREISEIDASRTYTEDLQELDRLEKRLSEYVNSPESIGLYGQSVPKNQLYIDQLQTQIEAIRKKIAPYEATLWNGPVMPQASSAKTQNKAYWEKIKEDAQLELEALDARELASDKANQIRAKIAKAEAELEKYNTKKQSQTANASYKAAAEEAAVKAKAKRDAQRELEDINTQVEQAEINALADGAEKRRRQIALDNKLELQQILRQKEDYIEAFVDREREVFDAREEVLSTKNNNYIKKTFDENAARELAGSSEGAKAFDAIYRKTQLQQVQNQVSAEISAWNDYLAQYGDYEQKKFAIKQKYSKAIANAQTYWEGQSLSKQMEVELYELEQQYKKTATAIQDLFGDMSKKSASDLNSIADEGEKALNFIKNEQWTADNPFGISQEAYNQIKNSPTALDDIAKAILGIREQADQLEGPIDSIVEGFKELFESKKGTEAFEKALSKVYAGVNAISNAFGFVSSTLSSMGDALGNEGLQGAADGINSTLNVVGQTMSGAQAGAAFGPWGAAAGAAIGLVTSLVTEVSKAKDAVKQARIDELVEKNTELDKSYEDLSKNIEKAYSVNASNLIEQQNTLLEQKKKNLELMVAEEQTKKNVDNDQVNDWKEQIDSIDTTIEQNAEKAKDAITGISFNSFRDNFISALMDMEGSAEDFADDIENTIRKAMYDALIAQQYQSQLQNLYNNLAEAVKSGDESEIARVKAQIYDLYDKIEAEARDIDDRIGYEASSSRSASAKGIAQASQSSVDELNGRMTAIQSHTFSINEHLVSVVNTNNQILSKVNSINSHTSRLEEIERTISYMRSDIEDIVTKGIKLK